MAVGAAVALRVVQPLIMSLSCYNPRPVLSKCQIALAANNPKPLAPFMCVDHAVNDTCSHRFKRVNQLPCESNNIFGEQYSVSILRDCVIY